ncbi:MAG: hypothetical protein IIW09_04035 [Acetobacter sp.]|nr:hypothetical protein [Acetobacter sp.]
MACCVKLLLWRWGVEVPPALGTETTTSVLEVVHSLYDKAHAFEKNGQHEAAISVYDDLLHRFGGSKIWQFNELWRRL